MFWPSIDVARRVSWSRDEVWANGPSYGDLLIALRPALRALFLQGYRTNGIAIGIKPGGAGPIQWNVIDLESFALTKVAARYPSVTTALEVAFETTAMNDGRGVAAPDGYGMTDAVMRLGMDGALDTNGTLPQALTRSIDAFVDAAVSRLAALVRNDAVPRNNHQGLLWIFDPRHFGNLEPDALDVVRLAFQNFSLNAQLTIREQVTDRRIEAGRESDLAPDLRWLTIAVVYIDPFWHGLRASLEDRGESERLTINTQQRLSGENAASWLDVIVELLRLGVLDMDGLIEAVEPVEPLVAIRMPETDQKPESIDLRIWGETTLSLFRVTPTANPGVEGGTMTGVDGAAAWEYVRNPGDRPRVVIVASRGISIAASEYSDSFPWFLDIYRVQDDALVPPVGATIDPSAFLGPATIEPRPGELSSAFHSSTRLVVRGKKDGLFLEYPMKATHGQNRFMLELTLDDPRSGTDGFIVDVHYYDYAYAANLPLGTGVHICVWATPGVTIESNGTPTEGKQAAATTFYASQWTASAEFWEFDDLRHILYPFSDVLPITPRLAWKDDRIAASVPRFPDDETTQRSNAHDNPNVYVLLARKYYTPKTYDDSFAYLVIDFVIGLVPGIGDLADAAELTIAWTTGLDKWGRPVSNYELAFMTVATFVPFVSAGFAKGVAGAALEGGGDLFRGEELVAFFREFVPPLNRAPTEADVEQLASVAHAWSTRANWGNTARANARTALLQFLTTSSDAVAAFSRRMKNATGEMWFTLDDIYDAEADGFRIGAINAAYRRWQSNEAGRLRDPHTFLETLGESSTERGTAKIVAEALLGPQTVSQGARYIPQGTRFPSACRPAIGGERMLLTDLDFSTVPPAQSTRPNFHAAVDDFVQAALEPGTSVRVVESYALRAVTDVVEDADQPFLADASRRLTGSLDPDEMDQVVGNNEIAGLNLSLPERAARFGTALFVACAEMRSKLLSPEWLLNDTLLPQLRLFVKEFINNKGVEVGMRFELARAGAYFRELAGNRSVEAIRTQLRMPVRDGLAHYLQQGPDIVLYLRHEALDIRRAVFVQLKAYTDLSKLALRPARFTRDANGNVLRDANGHVTGVHGPEFLHQAISDALRVDHDEWQGMIPGPGEAERVPGDVTDWVRTANVHVLLFDDVLIRDLVYQLVLEAQTRTRLTRITAENINPPNECVRQVFEQMFPDGLDVNNAEEAYQLISRETRWFDRWAQDVEDWINTWLEMNFDDEYGEPLRFIVRRGSVDPNDIVRDVLARIPGLE
jgi:hypothetical protein